jgi:hypothetical protein
MNKNTCMLCICRHLGEMQRHPDEHSTDEAMTRDRRVGPNHFMLPVSSVHNHAKIRDGDLSNDCSPIANLSLDVVVQSHIYIQFTNQSIEFFHPSEIALNPLSNTHLRSSENGNTTSNNSNPLNRQHGRGRSPPPSSTQLPRDNERFRSQVHQHPQRHSISNTKVRLTSPTAKPPNPAPAQAPSNYSPQI